MNIRFLAMLNIIFVGLLLQGCGKQSPEQALEPTDLILFHADALAMPFSLLEAKFEAEHPHINLKRESSGSNAAAMKITGLKRPCDIIAVADYRIIDKSLIPPHASWSIRFATNQIVLAYGNSSKYASEITPDNWYEILLRDDVSYGHSNPALDPCGYWTLIAWQLSDMHYGPLPDGRKLSEALDEGCPAKNIRADLNDLHPLLATAAIDYVFMYRSVAQQHRLSYVELPPEINLGDPAHEATYKKASVTVQTSKGPVVRTGTPIVFAITILDNAQHAEAATEFLKYLFGPVGEGIMSQNGQALLQPLLSRKGQPVPEPFSGMVRLEE